MEKEIWINDKSGELWEGIKPTDLMWVVQKKLDQGWVFYREFFTRADARIAAKFYNGFGRSYRVRKFIDTGDR